MGPRLLSTAACVVLLTVACGTARAAAAEHASEAAATQPADQSVQADGGQQAVRPARIDVSSATPWTAVPQARVAPGRSDSRQRPRPSLTRLPLVSYPSNWPEIARRHERYGALERAEDKASREARQKFNQVVGEIDFESGATLADAIERIRRDSGLNIVVTWPALEAFGITPSQEVILPRLANVPWRKVLELVLQQASAATGGVAELDWMIDSGVITVSTRDDLSRHLTIRIYDIGDLLVPRQVVQRGQGLNQGGFGTGGLGGSGGLGGGGIGFGGGFGGGVTAP